MVSRSEIAEEVQLRTEIAQRKIRAFDEMRLLTSTSSPAVAGYTSLEEGCRSILQRARDDIERAISAHERRYPGAEARRLISEGQ